MKVQDLPDDTLMEILSYEVSHRKWRLVSRKFAKCVALHVVVNEAPTPEQEGTILAMLGYRNCRSLSTSDWSPDAAKVADRIRANRSLKALSIKHSTITPSELQLIIRASASQASIETWSFGHLDLGNEALEALAVLVSSSKALRRIHLDGCNVGPDGLEVFGQALAQSAALRSLTLKAMKFSPEDLQALLRGVQGSPSLQELSFAFTPLGHGGAAVVGQCLATAGHLQTVNLDFCNVGPGIKAVMEGVCQSPTIVNLSLKGNQLGDGGTEMLADVLDRTCLQTVNLYDNGLQHFGAQALGQAIAGSSHLRELQLGANNVGARGCQYLAEGIARSASFTKLGLAWNGIDPEGVVALAKAFLPPSQLRSLNLSHNNVGIDGARALQDGIRQSKVLEELDLEGCNLDEDAVLVLTEAIRDCPTLLSVNLAMSEILPAAAEALANSLAASTSLTTLSVRHSLLSEEVTRILAHGLGRSRSLRHLDLQGCNLCAVGVTSLAEGVANARRLETLNLVQNGIGEDGARALAEGIARAPMFSALKLLYNDLGPSGTYALMQAMQQSCTFNSMELSTSDLAVQRPDDQLGVRVHPDPEDQHLEVEQSRAFTCSRCKHKLYTEEEGHKVIIYCVDSEGIIMEVMTPEEWKNFAEIPLPEYSNPCVVQGQPLNSFMEQRLAGFYNTLCNLIWNGDMCHTQFQWYCDDPENRREMFTFIYRSSDMILFCNVTMGVSPHQVPMSFMSGKPDSLLWRCPFCGWSCCNGGDWMEPEEFYLWLMTEWPALMRDHEYYPVVCEECLQDWVQRYDNPELHAAIQNLRAMNAPAEAAA